MSVNVSKCQKMSVSVSKHQQVSVNVSHLVTSALVCNKASVRYQIANSTFFTTSALVLKFSAFLNIACIFFAITAKKVTVFFL